MDNRPIGVLASGLEGLKNSPCFFPFFVKKRIAPRFVS